MIRQFPIQVQDLTDGGVKPVRSISLTIRKLTLFIKGLDKLPDLFPLLARISILRAPGIGIKCQVRLYCH